LALCNNDFGLHHLYVCDCQTVRSAVPAALLRATLTDLTMTLT
jgi:hypothetical protein